MEIITERNVSYTTNDDVVIKMNRIEAGLIEDLLYKEFTELFENGERPEAEYSTLVRKMRACLLSYIGPANYGKDRFQIWKDYIKEYETDYNKELYKESTLLYKSYLIDHGYNLDDPDLQLYDLEEE